jgi:predicted CxxxxCH...CXXCH cytochrome family protein
MTRSAFGRNTHPRSRLAVVIALLAVAGCGEGASGPTPNAAAAPAPAVGAPPSAPPSLVQGLALNGAPVCIALDVHQKHLSKFSCDTCHSSGGAYGFDVPNVFPRGTTTAGGVLVLRTDTAPTTCTVACHFPMGGTPKAITWSTPGPLGCTDCHDAANLPGTHPSISPASTTADCQGCHQTTTHLTGTVTLVGHDAAWIAPTSPAFHAFSADRGLARCQACHGQDLEGGAARVSCGICHDGALPDGVASWKANCVMCHGGANDPTGAPPKAVWGFAGDPARGAGVADPVRVGAHGAHVGGSTLAPAFDCNVCHAKPADVFTAGHIDSVSSVPLATVTFGGLAVQALPAGIAAAWDRPSATCSNTYCHGATLPGGTLRSPVWTTVDGSQAACGTCHGVPPPSHTFVNVSSGLSACNPCHSETIDQAGAVIPPGAGGKHLDGVLEATGHSGSWMDTASSEFHAYSANQGLASCQACHGANLDGVGGMATVGCAQCHRPGGPGHDFGTCTACHGGTDNASGAPPAATWGHDGDPARGGGTRDAVRVGAHTAHVSSGPLTTGFDCDVCHVRPASVLDAGHVDGPTATVTFRGVAAAGTTPAWNRATTTCASTYCHGATLVGGKARTPNWTRLDGSQATCTACHGYPPNTGRHYTHNLSWGIRCEVCHPIVAGYVIDPTLHVNGAKDLNRSGTTTRFGGFADWNPAAAGAGTLRGTATGCHGGIYYWTGSPPPDRYGCR